jgi:hypothetical protein
MLAGGQLSMDYSERFDAKGLKAGSRPPLAVDIIVKTRIRLCGCLVARLAVDKVLLVIIESL